MKEEVKRSKRQKKMKSEQIKKCTYLRKDTGRKTYKLKDRSTIIQTPDVNIGFRRALKIV